VAYHGTAESVEALACLIGRTRLPSDYVNKRTSSRLCRLVFNYRVAAQHVLETRTPFYSKS
jgi:hypothetical protein